MLGFRDTRQLGQVLPLPQARKITKHLGMSECQQLLEHYPRKYLHYGSSQALLSATEGDTVSFMGTVVDVTKLYPKGKFLLKITLDDGLSQLEASFFNARYLENLLTVGTRLMVTGALKFFRGQPQLSHPDYVFLDGTGKASGALLQLGKFGDLGEMLDGRDFLPVYPAVRGASTWTIMGAVHKILESIPPLDEPLGDTPDGFIAFDDALRHIHQPGPAGPAEAVRRLKYNEAMSIALVMALRRVDASHQTAPALPPVEGRDQNAMVRGLPFPLTRGQQQVVAELSDDLARTRPMMRLLQGEVGSGKTIVALLAMLQAIDNGKQCALLAPTEVLAMQHARSLQITLMDAGVPVRVVALTGSMTTKQKQEALLAIVTGEADIVVGTHALIQDSVDFFDLGFVVVDEQHRFGVEQRDQLRTKNERYTPHMLVMTATPIPRTIAMTVFADLEVSTLRELPGGRKPIQSSVVPEFFPKWVARAWEKIREEVYAGHQAYVVCPRIEGDGGVLEVAEHVHNTEFAGLTVGVLHGRMKGDDKDAIMKDFAAGGIDVLVSTTVIEVGVDVPNATVMLIRESESFGVSQLHQLRGRVGRGGHKSLCLFHTLADEGTPQFRRVAAVADTSDGFELAELDLATRSEGDVLGTSQSGTERRLKLLSLTEDFEIIHRANEDAEVFVDKHPEQARALVADLEQEDLEYLEKS
ncbi:ATP-dependent DNA helicase RecG [Corynebacterium cystitidis]|uniref:Probable DNA 3'-5' helicase RecG n=1 Tax=Corynebacterium cystitidis DSM 20524 TaxID=1121357 RepID=A0A1H9VC55_9CORY|nr:ATP-dependent DNA helicase RecG [Corynebacterium cystitidis]WJY82293.1 ATP-dependent DNA helicase RecG [Corynebacterium cystitidis DSM 20524]SES19265.1 ATP-dependent DNA helicase RecG [Corynebacterium cystitidis DSM 20524]SNV76768.1 ATP-dependent DNA helicase recG [Corynebacterium cystitidis]